MCDHEAGVDHETCVGSARSCSTAAPWPPGFDVLTVEASHPQKRFAVPKFVIPMAVSEHALSSACE